MYKAQRRKIFQWNYKIHGWDSSIHFKTNWRKESESLYGGTESWIGICGGQVRLEHCLNCPGYLNWAPAGYVNTAEHLGKFLLESGITPGEVWVVESSDNHMAVWSPVLLYWLICINGSHMYGNIYLKEYNFIINTQTRFKYVMDAIDSL